MESAQIMSSSNTILFLAFVFIATAAENPASHKYVVEKGNRSFMASALISEHTPFHFSQRDGSSQLLKESVPETPFVLPSEFQPVDVGRGF